MPKGKSSKRPKNFIYRFFHNALTDPYSTEGSPVIVRRGYNILVPSTDIEGIRHVSHISLLANYAVVASPHSQFYDQYDIQSPFIFFILFIDRSNDPSHDPMSTQFRNWDSDSNAYPVAYPQNDIIGTGTIPVSSNSCKSYYDSSHYFLNNVISNQLLQFYYQGHFQLNSGDSIVVHWYVPEPFIIESEYALNMTFGIFNCAISF